MDNNNENTASQMEQKKSEFDVLVVRYRAFSQIVDEYIAMEKQITAEIDQIASVRKGIRERVAALKVEHEGIRLAILQLRDKLGLGNEEV